MTLIALSPENGWEFITAMSEAWAWTQDRKRFYRASGARMTVEEFIEFSKAPNKKQIAVVDDRMAALITVWLMTDGVFDVHVIAPRKSRADMLLDALMAVRNSIFDDLGASVIRSSFGRYRGHSHTGIKRILDACGMAPIGSAWRSDADNDAVFQEYEITRENYVKSATRTNQRLQVFPEIVMAGA